MSTIDQEAVRWLVRNSGNAMGSAEREAFDAWFAADIRHKGAYARAAAIQNALSRATVQESLRPRREQLEIEWAGASWNQASSRRAFLRFGAMAAGVAVIATASVFSMLPDDAQVVTAKGEFRKVQLADHSVATVNSGSGIEVSLTRSARDITLRRGEAWFDVARDKSKPFTVAAGDVRARAVGTAFGVRRFANGAEVMVTEGSVEVWSSDGAARKYLLAAGDSAFVPSGGAKITVKRQPEEIERKLAWREGKVIFVNQTLDEAVADFNRYSLRKIVVMDPRLGSKTLVGQYPIDAPEVFAKDVSLFLEVPLVITADRIMIGEDRRAGARI